MTVSREQRGAALLLAAAALWSINGLLIKTLHAWGLGGCTIAAVRSLMAGLFLMPFAIRRWTPIPDPWWTAATVALFTCMCSSFVLASTLTTAANAIILQYTAPIWVFLLSPWLVGDRTDRRQWAAFGLSLSAVLLIFLAQCRSDAVGLSVGLASGVVFGCQCVFFRRVRALDAVVLAFLSCVGSGIALLPIALVAEGWQLTVRTGLLLAFMAVVQFGLPYVLYAAGVKHVAAQRAVLLLMLEPVLNPVWAYLGLGERPHWSTLVGGIVILVSVLSLSVARPSASRPPHAAEVAPARGLAGDRRGGGRGNRSPP
jgi:drug/metabolite transporter (DMT)-like permease